MVLATGPELLNWNKLGPPHLGPDHPEPEPESQQARVNEAFMAEAYPFFGAVVTPVYPLTSETFSPLRAREA